MTESYIVSARKYRPQTFDTVVGQEHITTTLKNAIRHQHLAHAYLFCGPRGVGKTTCARILAKTINCENPDEDMEACGICPTCLSFANNTSFNVFELDAASNNSVDDIRSLIDQVRFAPQQGKYKIYIIDEVHMLSASAFNAFLKTLEEPPPYAIFILATTEKHKILPTILSRCQIFDFKRITTSDIVSHLQSIANKEHMIAQEAALHVIAQKSEGAMRDALSMLDRIASFTNGMLTYSNTMEHLNMLDADFYFSLNDSILSQDVSGTLLQLDQTLERGFEGDVILTGLAEHMRNLLLCKDARMAKLLDVPNDHRPIYYEKANQTPPSFILSALNVVNDSELSYKLATNKRLHVEICLIRLCYLLQATKPIIVADTALPVTMGSPQSDEKKNNSHLNRVNYSPNAAPTTTVQEAKPELHNDFTEVSKQTQSPSQVDPPAFSPQGVGGLQSPASSKRVSKNFLGDLDAEVKNAAASTLAKKELTVDLVMEVYEKYKKKLQSENKSVYHAQFGMMKAEMLPNDEICLVAPNDLTETYAKELRNQMIDYFREHTGVMVRITTLVRENKELEFQQQPKVLSKSEMYDAMAQKNPNLSKLKDSLNLQIDY